MKMRIVSYLVLVVLFLFAGNSFSIGEDEIIGPQGSEGPSNVLYGNGAGDSITTGYDNTVIGVDAGNRNKAGYRNTLVGRNSGKSNINGYDNTFLGMAAGHQNTSGFQNTFLGRAAGYANTTGDSNTFVGYGAGNNNNSSSGYPYTGSDNTFVGHFAGWSNTTGFDNSFFGRAAGHYNKTGYRNSFFGWSAGSTNTIGCNNSFFGENAGSTNTDGSVNSFFGANAGENNISGYRNSFFGAKAGGMNKTGFGNVFLGYGAGYHETGSNKLYIDYNTDFENPTHPLIWGDFDTNNVIIYGGFKAIASYSSSDGRWKKNIEPLESSLEKVSDLQGVSYEWKTDEYPDMGLTSGKQIGLVAQEVEQILPELVSEDKDGYKAVSYTKLTAVLVEAVKELKTQNQAQKEALHKQQAEIEELRSMIKKLKS